MCNFALISRDDNINWIDLRKWFVTFYYQISTKRISDDFSAYVTKLGNVRHNGTYYRISDNKFIFDSNNSIITSGGSIRFSSYLVHSHKSGKSLNIFK